MARISAEIDFMVSIRNVERLSQFARSGTKMAIIIGSASLFHQRNSAARFDRADQDQAIAWSTFYQHVQHPMHAVIEINVSRARFVPLRQTHACSAG